VETLVMTASYDFLKNFKHLKIILKLPCHQHIFKHLLDQFFKCFNTTMSLSAQGFYKCFKLDWSIPKTKTCSRNLLQLETSTWEIVYFKQRNFKIN